MTDRVELLLSFSLAAILLVLYAVYALTSQPSGGHPVGLLMGILGLLLMLLTETLYSLRKRLPWLRAGPLRRWLAFHIVTGIIGPWLVLLHTAFAFHGLAGLAMALTILVTLSGFVGRYIYTAVPRTLAGVVVARQELAARLAGLQAELESWAAAQSPQVQALVASYQASQPPAEISPLAVLTRFLQTGRVKRQLQPALRSLGQVEGRKVQELEALLRRRQELDRQMASLKTAQRLLRQWRRLHVPLGLTMFSAIALHIGATLYFGGLLP